MFRTSFLALLFVAAAPAFAQNTTTPAPAGPSQEAITAIQTAAAAFGQCVQAGTAAVPAAVTPEAGATTVLAGCSAQKQAIEQAVRALLATLPAEQRAAGEAQLAAQIAGVPGQIADGIRQSRAAPAPAPAPAQ